MNIIFANSELIVYSILMVISIGLTGLTAFLSYKGYLWKKENKEIASTYTSGTYKEYWYYYRGYFWFIMTMLTGAMSVVALLLTLSA